MSFVKVNVGETITGTGTLHVTDCPACGCVYAIPDGIYREAQRLKTRATIYCPNGHTWHYTGTTHEQQLAELRDEAARERQRREQADAEALAQRRAAMRARKDRDRLKRRAEAGVCPHCHRTFQQLARHVKSKHPDAG